MKTIALIILTCISLAGCDLFQNESGIPINESPWVNGYLASWQHDAGTPYSNWGTLRTEDIPWESLTHLTYFSLFVAEDGTPFESLDPLTRNNFNADRLNAIVPAAHEHNVKILFNLRGLESINTLNIALADTNRPQLIQTIADLINTYSFDGVNMDMDTPNQPADFENYRQFVVQLSMAFDTVKTSRNERPLLTMTALKGDSAMTHYAGIQRYFDQINIRTYNMTLPWRGWHAWHNSALENNETTFLNSSARLPSVQQKVDEALGAGMDREKIGIGINFYGYVWNTVNLGETWLLWPSQDMSIIEGRGSIPYSQISNQYNLAEAKWDNKAKVPYVNIDNPKTFISYDNEESAREKVRFAKLQRLGGVIIWELGAGHFPDVTTNKNPLMDSIGQEAFSGSNN